MRTALALFFCLIFTLNVYADTLDTTKVEAKSAVLMDMDTGRVLWGKNEDEPLAMASTTKIMTAIIALERGNMNDVVTVSKNATLAPPVKMYLKEGEEIRLYDLLLAMMLQSYNDSAVAVAEHIGGSVEDFCHAMNLKAAELGCTDTVFETPNGLDKGNHHSTARDMALITRYALQNDDFAKLVATPSASFTTNKSFYSFVNKDRLLTEYEGALGVKTGFTGKAGQCFAGAARRGEVGLVSVVLASGWGAMGKEQKWIDTKAILDYGFQKYAYRDIVTENMPIATVSVERGDAESVSVVARDYVRLLTSEDEAMEFKYDIPQSIKAPVKAGERIGTLNVYINGEMVAQSGVVTAQNVDKSGFSSYIGDIFDIFVSNCVGNVV